MEITRQEVSNWNRLGVIGDNAQWGQAKPRTSQLLDWISLGADSVENENYADPFKDPNIIDS